MSRVETTCDLIAALMTFPPGTPVRVMVERGKMGGIASPIRSVAGRVVITPTPRD